MFPEINCADLQNRCLGQEWPQGQIAARLDDNRRIEFNGAEHRHFDHGYAVTSHSAQGLTSECVLIHVDTGVHPSLLNSRFAYVSVSRASHDVSIFTNDTGKLCQSLEAEITKSSAMEHATNRAPAHAESVEIAI